MTPIFGEDNGVVKVGFNWKHILLSTQDGMLTDDKCRVKLTVSQAEELIEQLKLSIMWKKRWNQLSGNVASAKDRWESHKKLQLEMLEYKQIKREAGV
jgi:hypothetical protein